MKVIVATDKTQGQRKNDFCWADVGEIVRFGFECDRESVDDQCGCRRSMAGINTHKATTTMEVVDKDISREEFELLIKAGIADAWGKDLAEECYKEEAKELLRIANDFKVGDVIEKRGRKIQTRVVEVVV